MSTSDYVHFSQMYSSNVQLLLQQKGGKLLDTVTTASYTGKAAKAVEQVGSVAPTKNLARHSDTPISNVPADARWIYPNDYDYATLIDDQDKLRMVCDLQSPYVQNGMIAMQRAIDDEILQAIFGTAKTGENGSTSTVHDTSNQDIAITVGGANSSLNVAKLRAAKKKFIANGVDLESDPLYCGITATEHDALLNEIQIISRDYNTTPVLVDGIVTRFMGINFKLIEFSNSTYTAASTLVSSTTNYVPMWCKSGLHLGTWNNITGTVSQRNDKRNATQIYLTGTFGATRLEEKKVVRIACYNS